MKKFCSTCGNQLELSQRFCNNCGAVNPFFVSTFSFLSDQSEELEKLRIEKERIDKELAEKEERQAEFKRQEQLRQEAENLERLTLEKQEAEKIAREQNEREKIEQNIKMELLKVKEETNNWVNEVRQELNQIEEDNKKLKATVAELSKSGQTENKVTPATVSAKPNSDNGNRVFISILIILLAILSAVAFYYFITTNKKEIVATPEGIKQEAEAPPAISNPVNADTVSINQDSLATPAVSDTVAKEEIAPLSEPANKMNTPVHIETKTYKTASEFVLTEAKLRKDLIKKKISGCDIVINKASEIETISHLVLVEKLPSGQLKYKFTATIVKGSDTFTAIPYVYYKTSGIFIKIDGTNCE